MVLTGNVTCDRMIHHVHVYDQYQLYGLPYKQSHRGVWTVSGVADAIQVCADYMTHADMLATSRQQIQRFFQLRFAKHQDNDLHMTFDI